MTLTISVDSRPPRLRDAKTTEDILNALAAGIWKWGKRPGRAPCISERDLATFLCNGLLDPKEMDEANVRLNRMTIGADPWGWTGRFKVNAARCTDETTAGGYPDTEAGAARAVAVWATSSGHDREITESIPECHARWVRLGDARPPHPLVPLVGAWLNRPRNPAKRHIICPACRLVRAPAIFGAAFQTPLNVIEVDGEPMATAQPSAQPLQAYRQIRNHRTALLPGPKRINKADSGDMILRSLSRHRLSGDERSLVRSDTYRLGLLGYALTGPIVLSEAEGILLLTGRTQATESAARRWWITTENARAISFLLDPRTGEWADFLRIGRLSDGRVSIMAPEWWKGRMAWRLSGGLFRPALLKDTAKRGPQPGYWGGLHRMIAGIESALSWGPSAGRGKHGKIPDNVRPARGASGPGPNVFLEWTDVIYLSGEPVTTKNRETAERRYRDRVKRLGDLGYATNGNKPSQAGDTWEIVEVRRGSRYRRAGLVVRATDRFTEAVERSQDDDNWERLPVSFLLTKTLSE